MMDSNARKEQFSNAFFLAIAAAAGCSVSKPSVDNDSVDWTISNRLPRRPKLDVQLKCTANDDVPGSEIPFDLPVKNYSDLILTDLIVPRILVLVAVPTNVDLWLEALDEELILRRYGFWHSLRGLQESLNCTSVTIRIPSQNKITIKSSSELMEKINRGDKL